MNDSLLNLFEEVCILLVCNDERVSLRLLDPVHCLALWVDIQSPSEALCHEDTILGREFVSGQSVQLPGSSLGGTCHEVGKVESPCERDLLDFHSSDPVRDEAISVLGWERSTVAHKGGCEDAVTDKFLVLLVEVNESSLPTSLLPSKAGDESISTVDLSLEAVELCLEGCHSSFGLALSFEELS